MYNQTEAILSQYEIEVKQTTKGRGSYICDTDKGKKMLVAFRGSPERGEALAQYLKFLQEAGFVVEQIFPNKEEKAVTVDEISGERFILKSFLEGAEVEPSKKEEIRVGARLLGEYHACSKKILPQSLPPIFTETNSSVLDTKNRHYRELIKIRNHIRSKKKKNDFERQFMENCNSMLKTATDSLALLEKMEWNKEDFCFCHGDYNQHNIVKSDGKWHIIHMEGVTYSLPMEDVANYLRKMMEKNHWDIVLGRSLLSEYEKSIPLEEKDKKHLYALLLFPERFWKITNHYMNSHKAWVSQRDIEKLEKVIAQEEKRLNFIENLFSFEE